MVAFITPLQGRLFSGGKGTLGGPLRFPWLTVWRLATGGSCNRNLRVIPSTSKKNNTRYVHKVLENKLLYTLTKHFSGRWWNIWTNACFTSTKGFLFSDCTSYCRCLNMFSCFSFGCRKKWLPQAKLPIVNLEAGAPCKWKNKRWKTYEPRKSIKPRSCTDTFQLFNGDLDPYLIF